MANVKISELPVGNKIVNNSILVVNDTDGITKQVAMGALIQPTVTGTVTPSFKLFSDATRQTPMTSLPITFTQIGAHLYYYRIVHESPIYATFTANENNSLMSNVKSTTGVFSTFHDITRPIVNLPENSFGMSISAYWNAGKVNFSVYNKIRYLSGTNAIVNNTPFFTANTNVDFTSGIDVRGLIFTGDSNCLSVE